MDALESLNIESALAAQAEKAAAEDEVGQNDFLTMLVAQLENQDPLNPQDSADFAAQLAQFSSVEQLIAMRTGIDQLVAASAPAAETGAAIGATNLDPTNLVGKNVTVFGSQIQVEPGQGPVEMDFRTIEEAMQASVVIRDANGNVRHSEPLVVEDANGLPTSLRPGDHVYTLDPAAHSLPPGVYSIEFTGTNAAGEAVTLLPMVRGQVTGAILAGEPSIRMGDRIFSVEAVLEVSLPGYGTSVSAGAASAPAAPVQTGGGQTVYRPQPAPSPRWNGA